jgi:hypothetical protein
MGIAELALGAIYESLKIIGGELGSKLERELRDIVKLDQEGRRELSQALALKYPEYNDIDVALAEKKIETAKYDYEVFQKSYIELIRANAEAKK